MIVAFVLAAAVACHDGDTCRIGAETVRIVNVDCPELRQPGGAEARDRTRELVRGRLILRRHGRDRYGRTLATISADGRSVGLALVAEGLCWAAEPRYRPPASYVRAQARAMRAKRGLWSTPDPIAPWSWRRGQR